MRDLLQPTMSKACVHYYFESVMFVASLPNKNSTFELRASSFELGAWNSQNLELEVFGYVSVLFMLKFTHQMLVMYLNFRSRLENKLLQARDIYGEGTKL